jgi:hypothetical protein
MQVAKKALSVAAKAEARPKTKLKKVRKKATRSEPVPLKAIESMDKVLAKRWALHSLFPHFSRLAMVIPDGYGRASTPTAPYTWNTSVSVVQDSVATTDYYCGIAMMMSPKSQLYTISAVASGVFTWTASDHPNATYYTSSTSGFSGTGRMVTGGLQLERTSALSNTQGLIVTGRTINSAATGSPTDVKPTTWSVATSLKGIQYCDGNNVMEGDILTSVPHLPSSGLINNIYDLSASANSIGCCFIVWKGGTSTNMSFNCTCYTQYECVLTQLGAQNFPVDTAVGSFDDCCESIEAIMPLMFKAGCSYKSYLAAYKKATGGSIARNMQMVSAAPVGSVGAENPNEMYLEALVAAVKKLPIAATMTTVRTNWARQQIDALLSELDGLVIPYGDGPERLGLNVVLERVTPEQKVPASNSKDEIDESNSLSPFIRVFEPIDTPRSAVLPETVPPLALSGKDRVPPGVPRLGGK